MWHMYMLYMYVHVYIGGGHAYHVQWNLSIMLTHGPENQWLEQGEVAEAYNEWSFATWSLN